MYSFTNWNEFTNRNRKLNRNTSVRIREGVLYKDINAQEVSLAVSAASTFLQRQRSDSAFDKFYENTVKDHLTQEPVIPQRWKTPNRFEYEAQESESHSSPKEYSRVLI